ncbi:hypothetical protein P6709_10035 [Jeotgalibacillus sp. ET6]|uniref:hypothetical protein n=1 Tax=Jeotgalibacillus sp. ET6 TaxID=3037260 RepID=UPI0024182C23|nr:hypothetical protein [Jeotgalibacillus sp. ET6]MDG5472091.1 hypothetical protein [Jeotgalibacillus sp. ET6]
MRRILSCFLLLIFFALISACDNTDSNSEVMFSGESDHWEGEIILDEETDITNLYLTPNEIAEENLKEIVVDISRGQRKIGLEAESHKENEPLRIQIPEDVFDDTTEVKSLDVTVSWDQDDNTESFELVKNIN